MMKSRNHELEKEGGGGGGRSHKPSAFGEIEENVLLLFYKALAESKTAIH